MLRATTASHHIRQSCRSSLQTATRFPIGISLLKTSSTFSSPPAQQPCPKRHASPTARSSTTAPRSATACASPRKTPSAAHHRSFTASAVSWGTWRQPPTARRSSSHLNPSMRAQPSPPSAKNNAQRYTAYQRCSSKNSASSPPTKSPHQATNTSAPASQPEAASPRNS